MARKYLHLIERTGGDDIVTDRYTNTGVGVEFTHGGVTTLVPWGQVSRIRRADVEDLRTCDNYQDADVSDEVRDVFEALRALADDDLQLPAPDPAPAGTSVEAPAAGPDGQPLDNTGDGGTGPVTDPAATGAGQARETGGQPSAKELRAWAEQNSIEVPKSGPLPDSVKAAYAAAHTD